METKAQKKAPVSYPLGFFTDRYSFTKYGLSTNTAINIVCCAEDKTEQEMANPIGLQCSQGKGKKQKQKKQNSSK